jgi:hypothetical protein
MEQLFIDFEWPQYRIVFQLELSTGRMLGTVIFLPSKVTVWSQPGRRLSKAVTHWKAGW